MSRTLFLPMKNFSPDRHKAFISALHSHFRLIVHEADAWQLDPNDFPNTRKLSDEIGNIERLDEFRTQWNEYCRYVTEQLEKLLSSSPPKALLEEHFQTARPVLAESLKRALLLGELAKDTKIDAVVTGADYTQYSRPIGFMAEQLGIPNVHIEHGLFALLPYPELFKTGAMPVQFSSRYVVLDNELEVDIFRRHLLQPSVKELLPLGAPLDNSVAASPMTSTEGKQRLGIAESNKCVLVALSWNEPKTPLAPVQSQNDEVEFVKMLFRAVSRAKQREKIHIILKMHPAITDFGEFDGMRNFYSRLAAEHGLLFQTSILSDRLEEAVSSSSLVITWRTSSVLWDAVLRNIPTALVHPPWQQNELTEGDWNLHSPVTAAGLSSLVKDEAETIPLLNRMFDEQYTTDFASRVNAFKQHWNIQNRTVEEKSLHIIEWLKKMLA